MIFFLAISVAEPMIPKKPDRPPVVSQKVPEKLLPVQPGEEIIKDPDGFDPELKYERLPPGTPWDEAKKDPFSWA